jgi:hypothetical protein
MTKHSEPNRINHGQRILCSVPQKSVTKVFGGNANLFCDFDKNWDNSPSLVGLSFVESYLEGGLDIVFVLSGTNIAARCSALRPSAGSENLKHRPLMHIDDDVAGNCEARNDSSKLGRTHYGSGYRGDYQFVLVGDVENIQIANEFMPAWIRFEILNFVDDIFSGQMCFSISHGTFKAFRPFTEGELDTLGLGGVASDHCEYENIKCAPKIVDGISNYERDIVWKGNMLFDEMDLLAGFGMANSHEAERFFQQIGIEFGVKVIDVVLCPRNL